MNPLPLITHHFNALNEPQQREYEGAIVCGSYYESSAACIQYLVDRWNQGARFNHLYFLGSNRALEIFEHAMWWANPSNETEMLRALWEQQDKPQELERLPTTVYIMREGGLQLTTADKIRSLFQENLPRGNYLAISSTPCILHGPLQNRQNP